MRRPRLLCALLAALLLCGCAPSAEAPTDSAPPAPEGSQPPPPSTEPEPSGSREPGSEPSSEPTVEDRAGELLDTLSLEEKVGQLFLARCPEGNGAQLAAEYHLGGYVLFGRDFKDRTPDQVRADIASYQAAGLPMLIAVDEEGGSVARVSACPAFRSSRFPAPRKVFEAGGLDALRADAEEKARLLSSLGINVNLAPVCDVSTDPGDFIYDRSLGQDAQTTADYVSAVVEVMNAAGVGCALKHFPGYGNNQDTHTGIAVDGRDLESFRSCDLLPFQAGIDAGAPCVLVSHTIVQAMDPDLPASLSPAVHALLRDMGFQGVILTDDLAMDGIRKFTGDREAAVLAVLAGNDLLCCSDFQTQVPAVLAAVEDGTVPRDVLDRAVLRVLVWKLELGLFD